MAKSKNRNVTIEWCDVKAAYTAAVEDGTKIGNQPINGKISSWHSDPMRSNEWDGGSAAQTMKYIRQGYFAEALVTLPITRHSLPRGTSTTTRTRASLT